MMRLLQRPFSKFFGGQNLKAIFSNKMRRRNYGTVLILCPNSNNGTSQCHWTDIDIQLMHQGLPE